MTYRIFQPYVNLKIRLYHLLGEERRERGEEGGREREEGKGRREREERKEGGRNVPLRFSRKDYINLYTQY